MAVRLAIGASRGRLVRQLMVESLVIALAGGTLGLLIAEYGVERLSSVRIPSDIPIQLTFQMDHRVLWFTMLVACACALLFGLALAPALQSTKTDLVPALKAGELSQSRKRWFGRNALVSFQIAGSLVLADFPTWSRKDPVLVAATQLYLRTDHVISMSFDPTLIRYTPEQTEQLEKTLIDRVRTVPGKQSDGLSVPAAPLDQHPHDARQRVLLTNTPPESCACTRSSTTLTRGFEQVVLLLQQVKKLGLGRQAWKAWEAMVKETRAEINFELVERLAERESGTGRTLAGCTTSARISIEIRKTC